MSDLISLAPATYSNPTVMLARQNPRLPLPNYLSKEDRGGLETGVVSSVPLGTDIPFDFSSRIETEYFSKT